MMAILLCHTGRLEEARGLFQEALAGYHATLRAQHPHTQDVAADLETVLRSKAATALPAGRRRR